jgi:hypothetical protein
VRGPDPSRGAERAAVAVAGLKRHWALWWPEADLEEAARDVLARAAAWDLESFRPLEGGNVALVLASADVVLKVHPRLDPSLAAEVRALEHWAPSGVVPEVRDVRDGGLTFVMERVVPGTTADDLRFEERLEILGALAVRLHELGPMDAPRLDGAYSAGWGALPAGGDEVLLHADLHGGNALRSGAGWRVIDPHAVVGDRHADVWALIDPLAPPPPDAATARGWVARYARAANLDPGRAATWVRIRAAAEVRNGADGDAAWRERLRAWTGHLAD